MPGTECEVRASTYTCVFVFLLSQGFTIVPILVPYWLLSSFMLLLNCYCVSSPNCAHMWVIILYVFSPFHAPTCLLFRSHFIVFPVFILSVIRLNIARLDEWCPSSFHYCKIAKITFLNYPTKSNCEAFPSFNCEVFYALKHDMHWGPKPRQEEELGTQPSKILPFVLIWILI